MICLITCLYIVILLVLWAFFMGVGAIDEINDEQERRVRR